MPARETVETRAVTLVDIPLVRRLSERGTVLDSELCFTQSAQNTSLFTLLLPIVGVHTLVTRGEVQPVTGQYRLQRDDSYAHAAYVAPELEEGQDDTPWLHLLDAMAYEAGRRGAHLLMAEVEESSPLFQTMRIANFAVYARQEIWTRAPQQGAPYTPQAVELTPTSEEDLQGVHLLFGGIVPRLVQPITETPAAGEGLVYWKGDRLEGYIGIAEGKAGVYLTPHLHPDAFREAADVIATAISRVERCARVPVHVRVRRYQDWLDDALMQLGFGIGMRQAVMVKHIAAGVRSAAFAPLHRSLAVGGSPFKPPRSELHDGCMSAGGSPGAAAAAWRLPPDGL